MKKKILFSILIILVLLATAFALQGKVKAASYDSEIIYEEKYDGTLEVKAFGKYIESATIPEKINGKKVTSIQGSRI